MAACGFLVSVVPVQVGYLQRGVIQQGIWSDVAAGHWRAQGTVTPPVNPVRVQLTPVTPGHMLKISGWCNWQHFRFWL
ncbi:MAG: hypothetical protein BZ138_06570 [Methanosphaera sp. rholeuAM270]|nr:MAG: hypothetical protein BZ138_06570 [Methanosphaera sp. rholeuAM270]